MSRRQGPGVAPAAPVRPRIEEVVRIGHEARQQARQHPHPQPQPQPQPPVAGPTAVITPKTAATGVRLADIFRAESVQPFLEALAEFNKRGDERRFGYWRFERLCHRLPKEEHQARRALQRWYHIYVEASPVAATLKIAKELAAELHTKVTDKFGPSWVAKREIPHTITTHVCLALRELRRYYNLGETYTPVVPHLRTVYIDAAKTAVLYAVVAAAPGIQRPKLDERTFESENIDDLRKTLKQNISTRTSELVYEIMMKHASAIVDAWVPALDWAVDYSRTREYDVTVWEDSCPVDPTDAGQLELIEELGALFVLYYNTSVKECKPDEKADEKADEEAKPFYANPVEWKVKYKAAENGQTTLVGVPPAVSLLQQGGVSPGCDLKKNELKEMTG